MKKKTFKNKFKTKRCFIVGAGPSIRFNDISKLANEYVFAASWFVLHKDFEKLKNIFFCLASPQIWSQNKLPPLFLHSIKRNKNIFLFPEKSFQYVNAINHYFDEERIHYISYLDGKRDGLEIETDILKPIPYAATVVQDIMLPLSFYMGFKDIYLLGCDTDLNQQNYPGWKNSHFYDMDLMPLEVKQHIYNFSEGFQGNTIHEIYSKFKSYFEKNNKKIYNATTGGKLEVFKRVDFDSLFK